MKTENLNYVEPSGPLRSCNGTARCAVQSIVVWCPRENWFVGSCGGSARL